VAGPAEPHAYLADFGMAKVATDATLTQVGVLAGLSPAYAAPEQWLGERADAATDQYALAATLYRCLAGHPPFWPLRDTAELRAAHLRGEPPAIVSESDPRLSNASAALRRGLSKSPADRYDTCGELVAAVRAALAHGGVPVLDVTIVERADSRAPTDPEHPSSMRRRPQDSVVAVQEATYAEVGATTYADETALEDVVGSSLPDVTEREAGPSRRPVVLIAVAVVVAAAVGMAVALTTGGGGSGGGAGGAKAAAVVNVAGGPGDLAAGSDGTLWTANSRNGAITHLSAKPPRVVGRAVAAVPQVSQIAVGDGNVWAVSADGQAVGIEASSGRPLGPPVVLDVSAYDLAVGHAALWIANGTAGTIVRVPIRSGRLGTVPAHPAAIGGGASSVALTDQAVWAVSPDAGTLARLDPETGSLADHWRIGAGAEDVVALDGAVWVAVPSRGVVLRFAEAKLASGAGDARPDRTVSVPKATNAALVAGEHAVAYVSLDVGTPTIIDPSTGRTQQLKGTGKPASSAAVAAGEGLDLRSGHQHGGADRLLTWRLGCAGCSPFS
jgi:hypothetical protein